MNYGKKTYTKVMLLHNSNNYYCTCNSAGEERRRSALDGTTRSELPSEITVGDKTSDHRQSAPFRSKSPQQSTSFQTLSEDFSTKSKSFEMSSLEPTHSGNQLSQASLSAEESIEQIKKEFDRLDKASKDLGLPKMKTFAVSKNGDLISENSDSDKSQVRNADTLDSDLTNWTLSTANGSSRFNTASSTQGLSAHTLPESSTSDMRLSEISESTVKSSVPSEPKSSSFTTVTSDPSLDNTGGSNLSQYTMNNTRGDPLRSSVPGDDDQYVQQKFASLDNLISESKHLIAKHKQFVESKKDNESTKENHHQQLKQSTKSWQTLEDREQPARQPPALPKTQPPSQPFGQPKPAERAVKSQVQHKEKSMPAKSDLGTVLIH